MQKIIYPPRPRGAIPPNELPRLENTGLYCVQPKYQGSRAVIHISPSRVVNIYSRHGRKFHSYSPKIELLKELARLPGFEADKEYWLDGEILIKTIANDTKGKVVLFDVLHDGEYLFLRNQIDRLDLLKKICGNPTELDSFRGMGYVVSPEVMMAPTFYSNFGEEFNKDYGEEVEGLVLRKKQSLLDNFGSKEYLVDWIIRCRRENKNCLF